MPINFNILNPQAPTSSITPIASSSQGNGLADLFSGLNMLKNSFNPKPTTPYSAPTEGQGTPLTPDPSNPQGNNSIYQNASSMIGKDEHDPIIKEYLQKANPGLDPSVTPWCAGYVNSVLNASGLKGTNSLAARSYLNYGQPTDKPSLGDIVVLSRDGDPNKGHVGFYAGTDENGNVKILGGNQDNSVGIKSFPVSRVLGYRVPPTGQQVQQYAQQNNLQSPQQLANLPNVVNQQQYLPKDAHPELPAVMAGISHVETSGEKDPYSATGPATRGGKALGKYQIMSSNIPAWSTEALGYPVTPEQFLKDPEIQERVAAFKLNQYLKQGNSPEEVQSLWFTGRNRADAGNAKDVLGTTNEQYRKKFNQGYLKARYL